MTCRPESEAQRLERIATQLLAGILANPGNAERGGHNLAFEAIDTATKLIKQLDALAIAE